LNALPLTYFLDPNEVEILHRPPSQLKDLLRSGRVDAALLPIVDYFENKDFHLIPDIAIASKGAVHSVKLFMKNLNQPVERLKYLYLDSESKTSHSLLKVLLKARFGRSLADLEFLKDQSDPRIEASLLIGDKALHFPFPEGALDLGASWWEWTNKPFTFAAWMTRGQGGDGVTQILQKAREEGLKHLDDIVEANPALPPPFLKEYLTNAVQYYMGPEELEGIRIFFEHLKPIEGYSHELAFRFVS